jgi:hypothetical protein
MSFISVLKSIGRGIETVVGVSATVVTTVTGVAEPFVAEFSPPAAALLMLVNKATGAAEMLITGVQQGVAKKQTALQIIEAELPNVQAIVAQFGSGFVIPQAELSALIDASVAEKNALAAFVAAVKPKPKA